MLVQLGIVEFRKNRVYSLSYPTEKDRCASYIVLHCTNNNIVLNTKSADCCQLLLILISRGKIIELIQNLN